MSLPKKIRIVEVGPRDGLQNEKKVISTELKAQFIRDLSDTGHQTIEVTSFVRPDRIPQMSDAKELFPLVRDLDESADLVCLVPNLKGLELAVSLGVKEIAVFTASSDTFNQRNINATISQSFERIEPVIKEALDQGMKVRGYVSTAFGCPYEGYVNPEKVREVAKRLEGLGCYELSLGDTVGTGSPLSVSRALDLILKDIDVSKIALHFHDTRGMALANIMKGLEYGVSVFDASAGGLGGCPYAKGATGNVATEDLVYLCQCLGIDCGVDLDKLTQASRRMLNELGKPTTSKFLQAYSNAKDANESLYLPTP
jgi:hydroxymethylglutaryl-CoA lyase